MPLASQAQRVSLRNMRHIEGREETRVTQFTEAGVTKAIVNEAGAAEDIRSAAARRVTRLAGRARLAIAWEHVWAPLALILALGALFLTVSWLGLWLELPRFGRIAGIGAFSVALALALAHLWLNLSRPSPGAGLARLDRDSGLAHRPASTLHDQLASPPNPETEALWALHLRRAASVVDKIKVAAPSPRLMERDALALRAGALCALAASLFIAGADWRARIAAAFDWNTETPVADSFRLDAWIDPPAYTGKPPVIVQMKAPESAAKTAQATYVVPVNSVLILRGVGSASLDFATQGDFNPLAPLAPKTAKASAAEAGGTVEKRWVLRGAGKLSVTNAGAPVANVPVTIIPDAPPTIALTDTL